MHRHTLLLVGITLFVLGCSTPAMTAPQVSKNESKEWTLTDTISSALDYSPAVKREGEAVRAAAEDVRQAQAGHLPRVNVQGSVGAGTLPVSKYE